MRIPVFASLLALGLAVTGPVVAKEKVKENNNNQQPQNNNNDGPVGGTFLGGCALGDINTPVADACNGFYARNTLGASDDAITDAALAALGLDWNGAVLESIDLLDSNPLVDFSKTLSGTTYIGIHWGKGNGPVNTQGGVTGYYRLDLGTGVTLDKFFTSFGSNSGARLYATGVCDNANCTVAVPEPSSWALMILGFGGAGAMIRRRKPAQA